MNAITVEKVSETLPAPVSDTGTVLNLIARAASDPNCDIDKMERLMKMHAEMENRARQQEFNISMRAAQEKMRPVAKDAANPQTRSKYASYAALDRAVRPIYSKEGFALSFDSGDGAPVDYVRVECFTSHTSGFTRKYHVDMPADGKGAKGGDVMTKTHAVGSAFTYGQRYLLKMIFNLVTADVDDDGNAASTQPLTEDQVSELQALIVETGTDIPKFCAYMKVERVEEIPSNKFKNAVAALNAKKSKKS
jgi:hypothetical protein